MRLTLRALLAWMDENLPPTDAEVISQKIAESELATNLKNQIQSVVRIPYLPASIILDSTPLGDPNAAAEYLDNCMSAEETIEYEKHCIHSDVVLAEVASCHQILTMVLGEPAEVDVELRRKVYAMKDRYFVEEEEDEAPAVARVMEELTQEMSASERNSVPAAASSPWKPRLIRALVGAAVLLFLFWCVGRLLPETMPGRLAAKLLPFPAVVKENGANSEEKVEGSTEKEPGKEIPEPLEAAKGKPTVGEADEGKSAVPGGETSAGTENPREMPKPEDDPIFDPKISAFPSETPEPKKENGTEETPGRKVEFPGVLPASETENKSPAETFPGVKPVPETLTVKTSETEAPAVPAIRRVQPPRRVGRVESDRTQVLTEYNPREKTWTRMSPQVGVNTDTTLVSFPPYRPVISCAQQLEVVLAGASQLRVEQRESVAEPVLEMDYGRFLVQTYESEDGDFPGAVTAVFPSYNGTLIFAKENSRVAIEVFRQGNLGVNPENPGIPVFIHVYVLDGVVVVQPANGEPVAISAGSFVQLSKEPLDPTRSGAPAWVRPPELSASEAQAAAVLAEALGIGQIIERELFEQTDNRNRDVAWLATQCLGQLGNFQPLVTSLIKPEYNKYWNDCIEELRRAALRSAEQASDVRQAFERYTQQGKRLFKMLWAYPPPRMLLVDASVLVESLGDEDLSVRVLAHWNLSQFFRGEKPINYKPDSSVAQRATGIQRWRDYVNEKVDIFVEE